MRRSATAWCSLIAGIAVGGCGPDDSTPRRPDILIVTIDTLRADHLGCYGNRSAAMANQRVDHESALDGDAPEMDASPIADALARGGVLFERCFAPRGQTHPSLASMLTGLYPITHGLRANGQRLPTEIETLPAILQKNGYHTAAFPANLARERWDFWMRGFDVAIDGTDGRIVEEGAANAFRSQRVWDRRVTDLAKAWIQSLPDDGRPFFLWVHLYDVHDPYTPETGDAEAFVDPAYVGPAQHPTGSSENPRDVLTDVITAWTLDRLPMNDADVRHVKALYDGGVRGCDRKVGELFAELKVRGRWKDTLTILSSDHGDELADHHRYFAHGSSIYDGVLRVPLIMSWPRQIAPGRRVDGLTQNLDIFPTVLEAAGLKVPGPCEGESLLPVLRGERDRASRTHVFAEWEDLIYAVSDGDWKLIVNPKGVRPKKPPYNIAGPDVGFPYECHELYHIAMDPREQHNLFDRDHKEARRLNRVLMEYLRDPRHRRPMHLLDPEADASSLAGLNELGYIGSTSEDRGVVTIDCRDS